MFSFFRFRRSLNSTSISLHSLYSFSTCVCVSVWVSKCVSECTSEIHYGKHFIIKNNSRFSRAHVFLVVSPIFLLHSLFRFCFLSLSLSLFFVVHFVALYFINTFSFCLWFHSNKQHIAFVLVAWLSNFVFLSTISFFFIFRFFFSLSWRRDSHSSGANFYFHTHTHMQRSVSTLFLLGISVLCVGRSVGWLVGCRCRQLQRQGK